MRILKYISTSCFLLLLVILVYNNSPHYQIIKGEIFGTYYNIKIRSQSHDKGLKAAIINRLKEINMPWGITTIAMWEFKGCSGLSEIVIPDTVRTIEAEAFLGCTGLTNLVIPSGVVEIKKDAFTSCKNLKTIQIPRSFKSQIKQIFPSEIIKIFGGVKINYV